MNNKKQANKGSSLIVAIVVAVVLIINIARNFDPDELPIFFFAVASITVFVLIASAFSRAKAGKTNTGKRTSVELNRPFPQPTATKRPSPVFRHRDEAEAEEAVHCAHARGKEKYFEQIEGFYKNGLIDRAEYKALREKYEKLDLPEDYH